MQALLIIVFVVIGIPVALYGFWVTHIMLGRLCIRHARRFCQRHGLVMTRARWQPACEPVGDRSVKTESTLVQLDCLDGQKQRRLVLILAWPFGVRKLVSDEIYPESYDSQWPQKCA